MEASAACGWAVRLFEGIPNVRAAAVACRPPPPWLLQGTNALDVPSAHTNVLVAFIPSVLIGGAALGGTMPVAMELLAECSHPLAPGISANAVVGLLQITATINTSLAAKLSPAAMNVVMLASLILCGLLVLPVRERYERKASEQG